MSKKRSKAKPEFCGSCGAKKIKEFTGKFNERTGRREFEYVCPVNPCGHDGHRDVFDKSPSIFSLTDVQCARCGLRYSYG